ncbi:MAG: LutC/YkgG family protein [Nitrososphaerales archaeon]
MTKKTTHASWRLHAILGMMIELQEGLIDEFSLMFKQQAGNVYHTKSAEEAAQIVSDIVRTKNGGRVCCAPFAINGKKFETLLETKFFPFERILHDDDGNDVLSELGPVDVGITLSAAAISQTGSLVEVSSSDNERLLSSLSRIHISILEASKILANLSDLAPMIRSILNATSKKPTITLIGGPSRTSDIELKSVLGVHGPHEVHAIIIE